MPAKGLLHHLRTIFLMYNDCFSTMLIGPDEHQAPTVMEKKAAQSEPAKVLNFELEKWRLEIRRQQAEREADPEYLKARFAYLDKRNRQRHKQDDNPEPSSCL